MIYLNSIAFGRCCFFAPPTRTVPSERASQTALARGTNSLTSDSGISSARLCGSQALLPSAKGLLRACGAKKQAKACWAAASAHKQNLHEAYAPWRFIVGIIFFLRRLRVIFLRPSDRQIRRESLPQILRRSLRERSGL